MDPLDPSSALNRHFSNLNLADEEKHTIVSNNVSEKVPNSNTVATVENFLPELQEPSSQSSNPFNLLTVPPGLSSHTVVQSKISPNNTATDSSPGNSVYSTVTNPLSNNTSSTIVHQHSTTPPTTGTNGMNHSLDTYDSSSSSSLHDPSSSRYASGNSHNNLHHSSSPSSTYPSTSHRLSTFGGGGGGGGGSTSPTTSYHHPSSLTSAIGPTTGSSSSRYTLPMYWPIPPERQSLYRKAYNTGNPSVNDKILTTITNATPLERDISGEKSGVTDDKKGPGVDLSNHLSLSGGPEKAEDEDGITSRTNALLNPSIDGSNAQRSNSVPPSSFDPNNDNGSPEAIVIPRTKDLSPSVASTDILPSKPLPEVLKHLPETLDTEKTVVKYKTKVCVFWLQPKGCPYGDECLYAHGTTELRDDILGDTPKADPDSNPRFKTRICKWYMSSHGSHCPHGVRCTYAHGLNEIDQYLRVSQEKIGWKDPEREAIYLESVQRAAVLAKRAEYSRLNPHHSNHFSRKSTGSSIHAHHNNNSNNNNSGATTAVPWYDNRPNNARNGPNFDRNYSIPPSSSPDYRDYDRSDGYYRNLPPSSSAGAHPYPSSTNRTHSDYSSRYPSARESYATDSSHGQYQSESRSSANSFGRHSVPPPSPYRDAYRPNDDYRPHSNNRGDPSGYREHSSVSSSSSAAYPSNSNYREPYPREYYSSSSHYHDNHHRHHPPEHYDDYSANNREYYNRGPNKYNPENNLRTFPDTSSPTATNGTHRFTTVSGVYTQSSSFPRGNENLPSSINTSLFPSSSRFSSEDSSYGNVPFPNRNPIGSSPRSLGNENTTVGSSAYSFDDRQHGNSFSRSFGSLRTKGDDLSTSFGDPFLNRGGSSSGSGPSNIWNTPMDDLLITSPSSSSTNGMVRISPSQTAQSNVPNLSSSLLLGLDNILDASSASSQTGNNNNTSTPFTSPGRPYDGGLLTKTNTSSVNPTGGDILPSSS